jgi:hypothetical protein
MLMRVVVEFKAAMSLDWGAGRQSGSNVPACPEGDVEGLGGRAACRRPTPLAKRGPLVHVVPSQRRRLLRKLRLLLDWGLLVVEQAVHVVVNSVSKGLIDGWDLGVVVDEGGRLGHR